MTQKRKQLLLKVLCAMLPYGFTIYRHSDNANIKINNIDDFAHFLEYSDGEEFKPYLRPISSLTAEECDKLFEILDIDEKSGDWLKINDTNVIRLFTEYGKDFYEITEAIEYLYSIHVDFRNMIEKGLALEASEGMYNSTNNT